jgi:hypothetical protein
MWTVEQAVVNGKLSITAAAKVANHPAEVQRKVVAEIAAGRSIVEALAAVGLQERDPPCFDDKTLTEGMNHLRKLLDLRAGAYGPNDA